MLNVVIRSDHQLLQTSLEGLVTSLGFCVTLQEQAEVALRDLSSSGYAYPPPLPLPTVALIYADERQALEVLRLGYRGYMHQRDCGKQLQRALTAVARGEIWAERHVLGQVFSHRTPQFTAREREVLSLVVCGLSNKEIARRLDITENTVKGYVSKLLDKLEVKTRAGLIIRQQRHTI